MLRTTQYRAVIMMHLVHGIWIRSHSNLGQSPMGVSLCSVFSCAMKSECGKTCALWTKWICILYLYSTFLSSLQYSFTFTQLHTFILAALCCSMRHNSGFSILLKDTSACRSFLGRLGIELLTFRLEEDDHSTPSATATLWNVFYFNLHVFSSFAVRWALSATVFFP